MSQTATKEIFKLSLQRNVIFIQTPLSSCSYVASNSGSFRTLNTPSRNENGTKIGNNNSFHYLYSYAYGFKSMLKVVSRLLHFICQKNDTNLILTNDVKLSRKEMKIIFK